MSFSIRHKDIILILDLHKNMTYEKQKNEIIKFLLNEWNLNESDSVISALKYRLQTSFLNNYTKRFNMLNKNNKNIQSFLTKYEGWVNNEFHFDATKTPALNPNTKKGKYYFNFFHFTIQYFTNCNIFTVQLKYYIA